MIFFIHILFGAIIAAKVRNPALIIVFALLSHYILDAIPHNDYPIENLRNRRWKKSAPDLIKLFFDFIVGAGFVILIFYLTKTNPFLLLLGGFFAILPDLIIMLDWEFQDNKFFAAHRKFHHKIHTLLDPNPDLCVGTQPGKQIKKRKKFSFAEKLFIEYIVILFAIGLLL